MSDLNLVYPHPQREGPISNLPGTWVHTDALPVNLNVIFTFMMYGRGMCDDEVQVLSTLVDPLFLVPNHTSETQPILAGIAGFGLQDETAATEQLCLVKTTTAY